MKRMTWAWTAFVVLAMAAQGTAEVKVASVFQNNMVLQRGSKVPIWGRALPGEVITVTFGRERRKAITDANGNWRLMLKGLKASAEPRELTISGTDTITLTNVVVGEVWICSGQSNMQMTLGGVNNAAAEIAEANYPQIRMFTVPNKTAMVPQTECGGQWTVCTPGTAAGFSAVGYFFARDLARELKVPVGMLNTSWGGSPIEPWTSLDVLATTAATSNRVAVYEKAVKDFDTDRKRFEEERQAALRKQDELVAQWKKDVYEKDVGLTEKWFSGATGSGTWKETAMPMPGNAAFLNNYIGFVWCRREVDIPAGWVGRDLLLNIGAVDEVDVTYVNGQIVGETPDLNKWQQARHYTIPAGAVTNQHLLIVVRVENQIGGIGVFGTEKDYSLVPDKATAEEAPVSLAGTWTYAMGSAISQESRPRVDIPPVPGSGWDVGTIYNAMIAPLAPYAMRGAIWYQGESNAGQPREYAELLPAMIASWRKTWDQGQFPFGIVQLANFMGRQQAPIEPQSWADLRDSQTAALKVRNTGLAVIIDIGDAVDIHPRNKQDVGRRLGLWALSEVYDNDCVYSGPMYKSMKVKGGEAILKFDHVGGGLVSRGEPLVGFAAAGEDKVFHAAQARIDGKTIVVRSDKVATPMAVRYGWANNPICNLYNQEGLPASPFRTDDWKRGDVRAADGEKLSEPVTAAPAPAAQPGS